MIASAAAFQEELEAYLRTTKNHVRAGEMGAYLSSLFSDKREEVRAVIEFEDASFHLSQTSPFTWRR